MAVETSQNFNCVLRNGVEIQGVLVVDDGTVLSGIDIAIVSVLQSVAGEHIRGKGTGRPCPTTGRRTLAAVSGFARALRPSAPSSLRSAPGRGWLRALLAAQTRIIPQGSPRLGSGAGCKQVHSGRRYHRRINLSKWPVPEREPLRTPFPPRTGGAAPARTSARRKERHCGTRPDRSRSAYNEDQQFPLLS